jgi:hypothetical protein
MSPSNSSAEVLVVYDKEGGPIMLKVLGKNKINNLKVSRNERF